MSDELQVAEVNGTHLCYVEYGIGPTVVLVHGSGVDYRSWNVVHGLLAQNFRVISYSRRFHWPNKAPRPYDSYSIDEHVDDLIALISSLNHHQPAMVVGQSSGASIALVAALRKPDLVSCCVAYEPSFGGMLQGEESELERKMGQAWILPMIMSLKNQQNDEAIATLFAPTLRGLRFIDLPLSVQRMAAQNASALRAQFLQTGRFTPIGPEELSQISAPTLILRGTDSHEYFRAISAAIANVIPYATLKDLPRAAHMFQMDNPAGFCEMVKQFCQNQL
jgi:pimeloyl-ACP methyl ester carboxylesterase